MYRVITYRSKPLKSKTIFVMDDMAAEESAAPVDVEKKKKRRKKDEVVTYIIDGVEVREEDLTEDERLDIHSQQVLNTDGFYDPLPPIDAEEEEEEKAPEKDRKAVNKQAMGIVAVVAGAAFAIAGIVAAMIFLL